MFYSSPQLLDWPKQRQISQKRALIPTRLVALNIRHSIALYLVISKEKLKYCYEIDFLIIPIY